LTKRKQNNIIKKKKGVEMEIIAITFGVFGVGFWLGVLVQRLAFKDNVKSYSLNQEKIKERNK
tara:strand:- start:1181 stop:1369 length:189 start_codon:yes stop_codon:yes gene_type:complete